MAKLLEKTIIHIGYREEYDDRTIKIGDKVWGAIGSAPYATVVNFDVHNRYITSNKGRNICIRKDVTVQQPDGILFQTKLSEIYKCDERFFDINNKSKWDVNELLKDEPYNVSLKNGYFGSYSLIQYKDKQCIVFVDDRDAKVITVTGFYDKIYYNDSWSGDHRWNNDKPVIVYDKELGYNIIKPHCNQLLCEEWLTEIARKWFYREDIGDYLLGTKKKDFVRIFTNGTIVGIEESGSEYLLNTLTKVKQYTHEEILNNWILKEKPCAHIYGLEYKGAKAGRITKERAEELFKTHKAFNVRFNSAEWRIIDGTVCLLFRDYANSDYD